MQDTETPQENKTTQQQTQSKPGLEAKLLKLQKEINPPGKGGRNNYHNYNFARAFDIIDPARKAASDCGLTLSLSVVSWQTSTRTEKAVLRDGSEKTTAFVAATVTVRATLTDPDTGETKSAEAIGFDEDSGGKSFYKAMTGGQKYSLLLLLCLASEDDPERDRDEESKSQQAPAPKRKATARPERTLPAASREESPIPPPSETEAEVKEKGVAWAMSKGIKELVARQVWDKCPGDSLAARKQAFIAWGKAQIKKQEQAESEPEAEAAATLPLTEDPHSFKDQSKISDPQLRRFHAIAYKEGGYSKEGLKAMLQANGYQSSREILKADYEFICQKAGNKELAEHYNAEAAMPVAAG